LYPLPEWEKLSASLSKINLFNHLILFLHLGEVLVVFYILKKLRMLKFYIL
jgi:hypothetical protein